MYTLADFLNVKSAGAPSFSPSGDRLLYVSNLSDTYQVYSIATRGGTFQQLTSYEDAVDFAIYSPTDEQQCIFGKSVAGNEQTQLFLMDMATKETANLTNNAEATHRWGGWSRDGRFIAYSSTERNGTDFDVYVLDLQTRQRRCLLDMGGMCLALGFSPSGSRLIVVRAHSNADMDLYLLDVTGDQTPQHLTPHTGNATYGAVRWLPDETGFYLITSQDVDKEEVRLYRLSTRQVQPVLPSDWEAEFLALSRDGSRLIVHRNEDGYGSACVYDTATMQPIANQQLPKGIITSSTWSQDGRYLAFNLVSETCNTDVWVWEQATNTSWQVTKSPMGVPQSSMVPSELVHYESFDGLRIPAFVTTPPACDPSQAPAIVWIHGGPEAQARPGFSGLLQYFVYCGYVVIEPNVRGSTGYGKAFEQLDNGSKRLDSVRDLERLHAFLTQTGRAHPHKICLMGGSYGGYMVLAGLTMQPKLWAAGVDIVGIANLVTFLQNTASYRRAVREAEYGSLEHDKHFLEAASPINHVQNIEAPLMIIHGANDPRVPLSEAKQMYEKLLSMGRQVELLVYNDEGHGLAKLKNRLDAYPKVDIFLRSVVQGEYTKK